MQRSVRWAPPPEWDFSWLHQRSRSTERKSRSIFTFGTSSRVREPGASSLANPRPNRIWRDFRPPPVNDGGEWVINGQKVWTSRGREADIGMLLARTDPAAPEHRGISYFAFPMHQAGVDIRPLKEMTGYALFNEVFIPDARVDDPALIGGVNNGWAAAHTTLLNERAGLGAGGGNAADGGAIQPGTQGGFLERRAGDLVASSTSSKSRKPRQHHGGSPGIPRGEAALLIDIAKRRGLNTDAGIRQYLVKLHTLSELGRFNGLRAKAASEQGRSIPGMPNIAKLSMSQSVRLARDVGLRILGPTGTLYGYEPEDKAFLKSLAGVSPTAGTTGRALFAQAPSIYGGTDQIQRNIIGERVLGLPKEPGDDRQVPFLDLPKNA